MKIERIDLLSVSNETEQKLSKVIDASFHSSVFHTILWNKLLIEDFHLKNVTLLALDGETAIGFYTFYEDFYENNMSILRSPIEMYQSVYGGPICVPGHESIIPELLQESENLSSAKKYYIKSSPDYPAEYLRATGYSVSEGYTSILDLQVEEPVLFGRIKKDARYHVKKAIKNGVEIVEGNSSNFTEFYEMYQSLYSRINEKNEGNIFVLPENFCKSVWEEFRKQCQVVFLLGRLGNKYVNGTLSICFKDTIYGWLFGSKIQYRKYDADSLMYWELMRWGRNNGYKFLDLLGLDIPSIAKFKRSFGGCDVPFYFAAKKGRGYYRTRLLSYLSNPSSLIKRIHKRTAI